MRLTLRSLLGYMNNILEEEDMADMGRRIDESDAAKQLLRRTEDVSRRPRLAAPPVAAGKSSLDANTVAEYLDHVLPTEQVHGFENLCLESDVYLGEVASGHHILTMVLGKPAEVDPQVKEQMYRLIEDPHKPTLRGPTTTPAEQPTDAMVDRRSKPEVPEYLRTGGRSRIWSIAATFLIAALVAGGVLFGLGVTPDSVAKFFEDPPTEPPPGAPTDFEPPVIEPGIEIPTDGTDGDGQPLTPGEDPGDAPPFEPGDAPPFEPGEAPPFEPGDAPPFTPAPVEPPTDPVAPPDVVIDPGLPTEPPVDPVDPPVEPMDPVDPPVEPVDPVDPTPDPNDVAVVVPPVPPVDPVDPPTNAEPVAVGRLLSEEEVLLRYKPADGTYERLAARSVLRTGDELIVLDAFRPMITLSGVTIELDGGSRIKLIAVDEAGHPEVTINYGRAVVMTVGRADARVKLNLGEESGFVSFGDADSKLAVEVRPWRPLGANPAETPVKFGVDLYAISGDVRWDAEGADEISLRAPLRKILAPNPLDDPRDDPDLPAWSTSSQISSLDRRAKAIINQLPPDDETRLRVIEMTVVRRPEVRSLALRGCGHIGAYATLVKALDDVDQKAHWEVVFHSLRQALVQDPDASQLVLAEFEKLRPDDGVRLHRMLWGFSAGGLQDRGEAKGLVEYLDHQELEFRVLAYQNLKDITGMGLYYQPEDREAERAQALAAWRKRLEQGEIVPKK